MGDLLSMGDAALKKRIMKVLKQKCDDGGIPYPFKLIQYLEIHGKEALDG